MRCLRQNRCDKDGYQDQPSGRCGMGYMDQKLQVIQMQPSPKASAGRRVEKVAQRVSAGKG
jgi:hypothetical protein